jgi:hypothetical protein
MSYVGMIICGYPLTEKDVISNKIFGEFYMTSEEKEKYRRYDYDFPYSFADSCNMKLRQLRYYDITLYHWPCCWYNDQERENKPSWILGFKITDLNFTEKINLDLSFITSNFIEQMERLKSDLMIKDDIHLETFVLPEDCYTCT